MSTPTARDELAAITSRLSAAHDARCAIDSDPPYAEWMTAWDEASKVIEEVHVDLRAWAAAHS